MDEVIAKLEACIGSLISAAALMDAAAARLILSMDARRGEVTKITAALDVDADDTSSAKAPQELALSREQKEAGNRIAASQGGDTRSEHWLASRKTLPSATVQLLAKEGIDTDDAVDLRSLDAALVGLSVEHRIAIKSQLLRTGALTR